MNTMMWQLTVSKAADSSSKVRPQGLKNDLCIGKTRVRLACSFQLEMGLGLVTG